MNTEVGRSTRKRSRRLRLRPLATIYRLEWRTFAFWRDAFLLFWIFSFLGHVVEFGWAAIPLLFGQPSHIATIPILAVAAPYGLGVLALIWVLWSPLRRGKIGAVGVFIFGGIIATIIEFICAVALVLLVGHNSFWDYSDQSFNLFGFVCLRNLLAFGAGAVILLYYVFPPLNNLLNHIKTRWPRGINAVFWPLLISYVTIQIWQIWQMI